MNTKNLKVDAFLRRATKWQQELAELRALLLGCGLTEELKWGQPCYTIDDGNVAILGSFKEYCALMFFKGALLKDPKGILVSPGEHTQSGRQVRFTALRDIVKLKTTLKAYVREAIAVEKAGLKVKLKKTADYAIPEEFQKRLDALPKLKTAFEALTPGRQRAYILYFSGAKQAKTRASRVEKCIPQILQGKGLDD